MQTTIPYHTQSASLINVAQISNKGHLIIAHIGTIEQAYGRSDTKEAGEGLNFNSIQI